MKRECKPAGWFSWPVIVVLIMALAACGKHVGQSSVGANAREAAAPLTIDEIRVGPSADPSAITQQQTTQAPIVVVLKTHGTGIKTKVEMTLFDLKNGTRVGDETRIIAAKKPISTVIQFKNASGWTPGRYLVEVKLNGKLASQRDIDVTQGRAQIQTAPR